jgi:hypothetical protein
MREVALAYRRANRAARYANCSPPEIERVRDEAAHETYRRLVPDAPADRLAVSAIIIPMIAYAIALDTTWFWHGSDVCRPRLRPPGRGPCRFA